MRKEKDKPEVFHTNTLPFPVVYVVLSARGCMLNDIVDGTEFGSL